MKNGILIPTEAWEQGWSKEICEVWTMSGKYLNDLDLHRTDGPAVIRTTGRMFWFINGSKYSSNDSYQTEIGLSDEEMTMIILKYGDVR